MGDAAQVIISCAFVYFPKGCFLACKRLLLARSKATSCMLKSSFLQCSDFQRDAYKKICSEADGFTADSCLYINM